MCGKLKTEAQIGRTSLKFCIWVAVLGSLVNIQSTSFLLSLQKPPGTWATVSGTVLFIISIQLKQSQLGPFMCLL